MTIIYVRWYEGGVRVDSTGLLVWEDERVVVIAMGRYGMSAAWRHLQEIPKVDIRIIQRFEVGT
jgi:hypothetical protein